MAQSISDDEEDPWANITAYEEDPWGEMVHLANQDSSTIETPTPTISKSKTPSKSKKDEMEEYMEEFEKIIKLKNDYDKKITKAKKNFANDPKNRNASPQEKKEDFEKKKQKMKCINCGKSGGTIFSKDLTHVSCGNTEEPCELNIQIEKPTVINMPDEIENLTKEINVQKRTITEYKLDLLFDLDDEEVILAEFQNHKDNLEKLLSVITGIKELYDKKNTMVEVSQYNPDTREQISEPLGEKIYVSRKEELEKKQKEFNQLASNFKRNMKLYKKEELTIGKFKILSDAMMIYKNVIIPLQDEIRNLKYQITYMDTISQNSGGKLNKKEMPIYHFIPTKFTIENKLFVNF
jgi:hypothetical protein